MSFAKRYLELHIPYAAFIPDKPSEMLGLIVVIPACNEPELIRTIDSLAGCEPPACGVEVIVLVNEAEDSPDNVRLQNDRSIGELVAWKQSHPAAFFDLYPVRADAFPRKHAGAGLARKTAMDEGIRRFAAISHADGILVSLDADTLVAPNYLTEIERCFHSGDKPVGATIRFRHRIDEIQDNRHRTGIMLYEKYLHYYKQALAFTGFPHAIYTVGSAFSVRADAYVKQGGMSKRQAGEDFYFLHKLKQLGQVTEINTTCVFPSARLSDRVPFGTGPALKKWVDGDDRLQQTYDFQAFADLQQFFKLLPSFYERAFQPDDIERLHIPKPVLLFLREDHFPESLAEIKQNSSSFITFEKRFFQYFNAFKILKFLNFSHPDDYTYQDLEEAYRQMEETTAHFVSSPEKE
ncbi:glycosyltransferase family 2 protein [Gaoshiqia sp. Z1-71]|uniref:glycosyltransferase family 2 protein n=1 Tax=Gaoshiqia hydrogeniformans TaxID=3290090 RepID=UPI003BF838DE